jgi:hypothetical protein
VVGLALLMSSKKADASSNLGVKAVPELDKPTVNIDADDEGVPVPHMLEQVDPPQSSLMPDRYVPAASMPAETAPAPSSDRYVPAASMPAEEPDVMVRSDPNTGRWSVRNEDGSPVQPDATAARSKAQSIADHVRTKKNAYDRPKLAVWQALAGLPGVDGLYGPSTQVALQKMGAKNVPKPLFKGGE